MTSNSSLYVKHGGVINDIAMRLPGEILFCIAKFTQSGGQSRVQLRVYRESEKVDLTEPSNWTLGSADAPMDLGLSVVELSTGEQGDWKVNHLSVGESWSVETSRPSTSN